MIEWREPTMSGTRSIKPEGYTLVLVPMDDKCHIEAWYKAADGSPTYIGGFRYVDRYSKSAKKKAADDLYAACEKHLEENYEEVTAAVRLPEQPIDPRDRSR